MATTDNEATIEVSVADLDALLNGYNRLVVRLDRLGGSRADLGESTAAWRRLWQVCPPVSSERTTETHTVLVDVSGCDALSSPEDWDLLVRLRFRRQYRALHEEGWVPCELGTRPNRALFVCDVLYPVTLRRSR